MKKRGAIGFFVFLCMWDVYGCMDILYVDMWRWVGGGNLDGDRYILRTYLGRYVSGWRTGKRERSS